MAETTTWQLLELIADLERLAARLYGRFEEACHDLPPVAAFWHRMAGEERLHAVVVTAAREVFAPTARSPAGDWRSQLEAAGRLIRETEAELEEGGLSPEATFERAAEIERCELSALTKLIIERAADSHSQILPLLAAWPLDRHAERVAEGRERLRALRRGAEAS